MNGLDDRQCSNDQRPVGKWNEESVPVHVEEEGHIAHAEGTQAQPSHSLRCVNFSLRYYFLLSGEVLQGGKLIELVGVALLRDVVNVVGPVLPEITEVNGLF